MSAADIDAPEHAGKCVVRITSRPSTLEEDEWAIKEIQRTYEANVSGGCAAICILITLAAVIGASVGGFVWGAGAAGKVIGFAIGLVVMSFIGNFVRKAQKPQVTHGKPLGEIVTISLPILRAWKSPPVKYYDRRKLEVWIFEIAPHILAVSRLGRQQLCEPLYIEKFSPSERIEIDYYVYGKSKLEPGRFGGLIFTIRGTIPIQYEDIEVKMVQKLPTRFYCLDDSLSLESDHLGDPEDAYMFELLNMGSLIWDLSHPFYADTCHVIGDRPA